MASGSGIQDTHLFSCLLILDANRSMSGFPNLLTIFRNSSGWSFHSVASCSILDCCSASLLSLPGTCAAETDHLFSVQKFHNLQAILLHILPILHII